MDHFIEIFRDAISAVLTQCSGTPWKVQIADNPGEASPLQIHVAVAGNLAGSIRFQFTSTAGSSLAQAMLMTPEVATEFGSEEREAVEELIRQVCGVAASALRPRFADVSFQVSSDSSAWEQAATRSYSLEHGGIQSALQLCLSPEILATLQTRAIETDRPVLRQALSNGNLELLLDVRLGVRLRFGSRRMRLREILELHPGTVVELDRQVQEPVDLLVDTKLIATGEVVVLDGNYGLRVTNVITPRERVESLQ